MIVNNIKHLKYLSIEMLHMEKLLSIASKKVTTPQIFEATNVFHRDGLFSTEIFGDVGSKARFRTNGHIDLKLEILHPLVYLGITTMSSLHAGILDGTKKAIFDNTIKDFVLDENGETGYNFFMSKFDNIEFHNPNNSDLREFKITISSIKDRKLVTMNKLGVICAGLRDYVVDKAGKPSQGEINDKYRSVLNLANMVSNTIPNTTYNLFIESIRVKIQKLVLDLYLEQLNGLLLGKRGLIQSHLMSKTIKYGTRNVITADSSRIVKIGGREHLRFNEISVGIFQYSKAINPIAVTCLKRIFFNIFSADERLATVIDNKTFKTERIEINTKMVMDFTTSAGVNNYLNKFADSEFSKQTFGGDTYSFIMLFEKDGGVEIVSDTSVIDPADYKYLRPITNLELLYIAILPEMNKYYSSTTRYPAINQGSTFLCIPKIKPTISTKKIKVRLYGNEYNVVNYPIPNSGVYDAMSPNHTRLARSTADFDGDMMNFLVYFTVESIEEIKEILNTRSFYIGADNKLVYSVDTDILNYVILTIHKTSKGK